MAPIGALIAFLVIHADIDNDPAQYLKSGASSDPKYTTREHLPRGAAGAVGHVRVLMVAAWFRKRLYMGMLTALFGLAIFNLHWWGFGVPFVMVGRLVPGAGLPGPEGPQRGDRAMPSHGRPVVPTPSKRYTPPTARAKRS